MWTYTDNYDLIPNLYIRSHFKDDELSFYQIYPVDGYVLRIPSMDRYDYDDTLEMKVDENNNPIIIPYYTYGGVTELKTYDWKANKENYSAEPYQDGMIVN